MGKHNARRTRLRAESAAATRGASSREGYQASGTLEVSPPPAWHSAAMQVTDLSGVFLVFVPAPDQGFLEGTIYGESTVY